MEHTPEVDNISSQADEIEALSAIYQDEWKVEDAANCTYSIVLCDEDVNHKLNFQVRLPPEYPSGAPPIYEISAPWMSAETKTRLSNKLEGHFCDHLGENILFDWVEIARKALQESALDDHPPNQEPADTVEPLSLMEANSEVECRDEHEIFHGETLDDRRSTFQAHLAEVHNLKQVEEVLEQLKTNRKIAEATHNIWAYRILQTEPRQMLLKDSADDGETYAGNRLLHLLDILGVTNVCIIVTRWYGGIHLGPDRFKHINKVARNLLERHGYIKKDMPSSKSRCKGKQKNTPSKHN